MPDAIPEKGFRFTAAATAINRLKAVPEDDIKR
jgi:hypothetical protein